MQPQAHGQECGIGSGHLGCVVLQVDGKLKDVHPACHYVMDVLLNCAAGSVKGACLG
jgi:hypothetical protein